MTLVTNAAQEGKAWNMSMKRGVLRGRLRGRASADQRPARKLRSSSVLRIDSRDPARAWWDGTVFLATVTAQQEPQSYAEQHGSTQLLSVGDGDKSCFEIVDLNYTHGNGMDPASSTASFATGMSIAHAAGSGAGTEAIADSGNGNDRLALCLDRLTVNCFHACLREDAIFQRLQ